MRIHLFLTGIAGAMVLAGGAEAQSAASAAAQQPAAAAAGPAAPTAAASAATLAEIKAGQEVKDPNGETIGTVVSAGLATNGAQAVVVNVDGKPVSLPANLFTASGDTVASSVTKAQIEASIPKG